MEKDTITLTLEDDSLLECEIVTIFETEDGDQYIALAPITEENEENADLFLYRFREVDGQPELENIETDEEYEKAAEMMEEILDSME